MSTVLVVEDDALNVEIVTRLLRRKGYEVLTAGTRDEAIATATGERPDLILMDITIPNAAGEEASHYAGLEAARLLTGAAATQAIPIIAITGWAMTDDKRRFLEAGCAAVVTKPYEFGSLLETIASLVTTAKKP